MGSITSGVGLISGLDYNSIIDQLIALDARPRDQLLQRVGTIDAQKAAWLDISARITAMLARIDVLSRSSSFRTTLADSSNTDVLSASTSPGARPGTYQFVVQALASTHQFVSRGFTSRTTPLAPGTLTIESGLARVDRDTRLAELNGHTGVRRGSIRIVNTAGGETVVNLADALTVGEVVEKINAAEAGVTAALRGGVLVLTDTTGGTGPLRVFEVGGGHTAQDLGFGVGHSYSTTGELIGDDIYYLGNSSPLDALNDGLGVRRGLAGGDFEMEAGGTTIRVDLSDIVRTDTRLERLNHGQGVRLGRVRITAGDGTMAEVDLAGARTLQDVKERLEQAFGGGRIGVVLTGSRLVVTDKTDLSDLEASEIRPFVIEDLEGHAAGDLGIDAAADGSQIDGRDILHMDTLADVIQAVNYAAGNEDADKQPLVRATLAPGGRGLQLATTSGPLVLRATVGNRALADLGFQEGTYFDLGGGAVAGGRRLIGGIDTVLLRTLRGGAGVTGGLIQIEANGQTVSVDASAAETLADVLEQVQAAVDAAQMGVEVTVDPTGTRLRVTNLAGETPVTISGALAEQLGLAGSGVVLRSENLQRQYLNEATRLAELNAGRGVALGRFKISLSNGAYHVVDLGGAETLGDVLDSINALGGVRASINATGDGLLITDTAGGTGQLKIEEDGGTAARDLNILGTADAGGAIDGSYEFRLEVGGSDTLDSLAARISSQTTLAAATVLNDGTGVAPYRLSLTSRTSGAAGELVLDDGDSDLGLTMLARAQDARVYFGGSAETGILLTSATNTFEEVVDGLSVTVSAVDDQPVTVTIDRDVDGLVEALNSLVEDYNAAMDRIAEVGKYDAETETFGVLQGEGGLRTVERRLQRLFTGAIDAGGAFDRLSEIGLKPVTGNRLEFDEERFRELMAANPEALETFFAAEEVGVAARLRAEVDKLTGASGVISGQTDALDGRKELLQERVDTLNERLERKRARLLRQFQAMETALAQLQGQQASLANLAGLVQMFTTGTSNGNSGLTA